MLRYRTVLAKEAANAASRRGHCVEGEGEGRGANLLQSFEELDYNHVSVFAPGTLDTAAHKVSN